MRKIVLSLILMFFAICAGAQKYRVVHVSGGECMVNSGNGWSRLSVNASLDRKAVLKNTCTPLSEVILREEGTQNTYKVYMLAEQFELARFVTDKVKDKPSGDLKNFSGFMKDMITSSQAVTVNVRYDRETGTTHRDASESFVYKTDDFVRCIARQAGGILDFTKPMSLSSELVVTMDYDGKTITLANYGDQTVNCYLLAVRYEYMADVPKPLFEDNCVVLSAGSEVKIEYEKKPEDKRLVMIASEEAAQLKTKLLSEYIRPWQGDRTDDDISVVEKIVPFSISIL